MKKTGNKIGKHSFWNRCIKDFRSNWLLWVMFLPVITYYFIFSYIPMYGIMLAFKDYKVKRGIFGSEWIGFEHFERFFSGYNIWMLLKNTLSISFYSFVIGFPLAIIFALLIHYLTLGKLKKILQMVSYVPYFMSTVVICGLLDILLSDSTGVINAIFSNLGLEKIPFLTSASLFNDVYVWSGVWQGMGWSAIIYISALAGVDQEMHEAAIIDGASKIKRIWYIDLPSISTTIIMLLILNLGGIMNVGFEKVYMLQNDLNFRGADIIATYVYRVGLKAGDFGYSTAVGLFNTLVNLFLLVSSNTVARKATGEGLW